ncbi:MAG: hypothetical protein ACREMI_06495 [Gemmatimonadales bacterium]
MRTTVTPAGEALDVTRHTIIHTREFTHGRDAVWAALMSAESDLGLPLQSADPAAGMAIYYLQTATPRVAGRHASAWMECGRAPGGAPRVNTYHLTLRLTTTIEPMAVSGSRARVTLLAYARDRGTVSDQLPCSSTGQLEKRTLAVLAARLGA